MKVKARSVPFPDHRVDLRYYHHPVFELDWEEFYQEDSGDAFAGVGFVRNQVREDVGVNYGNATLMSRSTGSATTVEVPPLIGKLTP